MNAVTVALIIRLYYNQGEENSFYFYPLIFTSPKIDLALSQGVWKGGLYVTVEKCFFWPWLLLFPEVCLSLLAN